MTRRRCIISSSLYFHLLLSYPCWILFSPQTPHVISLNFCSNSCFKFPFLPLQDFVLNVSCLRWCLVITRSYYETDSPSFVSFKTCIRVSFIRFHMLMVEGSYMTTLFITRIFSPFLNLSPKTGRKFSTKMIMNSSGMSSDVVNDLIWYFIEIVLYPQFFTTLFVHHIFPT